MSRSNFERFIKNKKIIAIDTNIFIYQFQAHVKYSPFTSQVFLQLEKKRLTVVSSFIALIEILSFSKLQNNETMYKIYKNFLLNTENLRIIFPTLSIVENAVHLRWEYQFTTPDALQIATALEEKAEVFLSNDEQFKKIKEIKVVLLDEFI